MTATMNVSLPESLKDYVRKRVAEGHFSNPSDFIRALIRADEAREAQRQLERRLLEGLDTDAQQSLTTQDWHDIRRQVHARLAEKRRP